MPAVTIGDAVRVSDSADAKAVLQADSTTQYFLPPRMTTAQKEAIASPAEGAVVFDTDNNQLEEYTGAAWQAAGGGAAGGSNDISADTLTLNDGSELTIASGAITVTKARHVIDTEADAVSDDLVTVTGLAAGEVCIITAAHTDRTVVVKNTGGTDISCATGADITLDDTVKAVALMGNIAGTGVNAYPLQSSGSGDTLPVVDTTALVKGSADDTKQFRIEVDGFTAGQTRVATPPDENFTMMGLATVQTPTNKTISASANTIGMGSGATKTIASGVASAGTDRNLMIAAESGTADDLIEVTGLVVGESVLLVADAGDTITVKHNDAGATVKIHLHGNTDITLDEQNPLRLTLRATNVLVEDIQSSAGGGGLYTSVAILRDEKATTTAGGSASATTWNNRNLNTETYDPDNIVSISSNQFTPIAGDYLITVFASVRQVNANRLRLYNVTGAVSVEEGRNESTNSGDATSNTATLNCKFTANGTDAYRIDHYTAVAQATNGFGAAVSDGSPECYLEIVLRKLA